MPCWYHAQHHQKRWNIYSLGEIMKSFFSNPMSPFVILYIVAFIVATFVFGPVALFHPLATLGIVGTFLLACYRAERYRKKK